MKNKQASLLAVMVVASVGFPAGALAQRPATDAYVVDASGMIVKNPFGLCWRTTSWTPAKAIAECDPDLVAKPQPKPAAVPAPAAAPAVVPAPAPVRDSDGDGVPDDRDACANTVAGAKVDARGCELDSDGDGVLDRLDRCPGTRAGARVDASGCELAEPAKPQPKKPEVLVLKGVTFATNSASLTSASAATLDEAADALAKRGDVQVEVAGHTDNRGSAQRNRALSQQRAESVMRYLVSRGVNAANVTARGYGPDRPVADNRTEQGRATNRRVELVIR
jgi:OmpA-OmpF porin, OOP family